MRVVVVRVVVVRVVVVRVVVLSVFERHAVPTLAVEKDRTTVYREIRFDLSWLRREAPLDVLRGYVLDGRLPGWGWFVPTFVIVLGTADGPVVPGSEPEWNGLRVHVGGDTWRDPVRRLVGHPLASDEEVSRATARDDENGCGVEDRDDRGFAKVTSRREMASAEWTTAKDLVLNNGGSGGRLRRHYTEAPAWVQNLVHLHTPWGRLLDEVRAQARRDHVVMPIGEERHVHGAQRHCVCGLLVEHDADTASWLDPAWVVGDPPPGTFACLTGPDVGAKHRPAEAS